MKGSVALKLTLAALVFLAGFSMAFAADVPTTIPEAPVKGMVTMVDIGGEGCVPCRMMTPILKELQETYRDKAAIVAINVGKDHERIKEYGARVIPTQIFYDKDGKESSRHEGFMDKKAIVEILEKLGAGK